MAGKVYVTNYAGHDYSVAEKFGKLVFVTRGYISFQSLDRVKYAVSEGIKGSEPEDYLLLSGTSIICVLAAIAWYHLHKYVRLLVWDMKGDCYREVVCSDADFYQVFEALK